MIHLELIFVSLELKMQNKKLLQQFCFDLVVYIYNLAVGVLFKVNYRG